MYPPVQCHTEQFHCPKNTLCSIYSSLPLSPKPWKPLIFKNCSYNFAFSRTSYGWNHTVCILLRQASITQQCVSKIPSNQKAECQSIDAFKLQCWRRLLRVPQTARRSTQSVLKEINPEYSLEGLMLMLKRQYFGHLM